MADKKRIILPLVAVLGVATALYFGLGLIEKKDPRLKVSGNIEATETQIGFEIGGRLAERTVDEGRSVRRGDLVAVLDDTALAREADMRQADLAAANATLAELVAGFRRQDVNTARAELDKAMTESERLTKDYERLSKLFREQVVSAQEFDHARAAMIASEAGVKAARENLNKLVEGSRKEQIAQAGFKLEAARQALELSRVRLAYARIASPLDGVVLTKNAEPGEYVSPGTPIVTIGDLENIWLRAYVAETDLGRMRLGQTVNVTVDAFPGKTFNGTVSYISSKSEFTPKSIQTDKERVKLVYRVKIQIRNENQELKPGMPADAVFVEQ